MDILDAALIPVVTGLVQLARTTGLADRWLPALSLLAGLGVTAVALSAQNGHTWQAITIQGLVTGLAASGLYSGARATVERAASPEVPK